MLFIYGGANIIGNMAGKLLTKNANKSVLIFPFVLGADYIILFLFGQFNVPMAIITLIWRILAGIGGNINQYTSQQKTPSIFSTGTFIMGITGNQKIII